MVATRLASCTGLWKGRLITLTPSRTRSVIAEAYVSVVRCSNTVSYCQSSSPSGDPGYGVMALMGLTSRSFTHSEW
jgi:hypothetical protein